MIRISYSLLFLLILFSSGCVSPRSVSNPAEKTQIQNLPDDLRKIITLRAYTRTKSKMASGKLREEALRETALAIGVQSGLYWQSKNINSNLDDRQAILYRIFNFSPLILTDNILPPVLVEGGNSAELNSDRMLRLSDHTYQILQQAKFVTAPPTWREYLELNYKIPEVPDKTLLPRNDKEMAIWVHCILEGWKNGIKQADEIEKNRLYRLRRDYQGILLYRKLLAQNMVTKPIVIKTNLGLTRSPDGTRMSLGERILRIQVVPELETRVEKWQPVFIRDNLQTQDSGN